MAGIARSFDVMPVRICGWRAEVRETAEAERRDASAEPLFPPLLLKPEVPPVARAELEQPSARRLPDALVQVATRVHAGRPKVAHDASPMLLGSVIAALKAA